MHVPNLTCPLSAICYLKERAWVVTGCLSSARVGRVETRSPLNWRRVVMQVSKLPRPLSTILCASFHVYLHTLNTRIIITIEGM